MEIEVVLYGNLKAIYSDKSEVNILEVSEEASVADILQELEISPTVLTTVLVNGVRKEDEFLLKEGVLEEGTKIELVGPLAGG